MTAEADTAQRDDRDTVAAWSDGHRYTPAPRHRRRLLLNLMKRITFSDVLDAGCAQPFLLKEVIERFPVDAFGCDLSPVVVEENRRVLPDGDFRVLDLSRERWPDDRQFDLVVCSEVLEHIEDWTAALANVVRMSRRHLLITVPGGPLRAMDRMVGHHRHYRGPELVEELEKLGCHVERVQEWGWPLHSAYKSALSLLSPASLYQSFSGGKPYGPWKKAMSEILYRAFFVNDLARHGHQLIVQAAVPVPSLLPKPIAGSRNSGRITAIGGAS